MSKKPKHVERDARDFYPTPLWCVSGLYEVAPGLPHATLDPCAGTGNLVLSARTRRGAPIGKVKGIELDPDLVELAWEENKVELIQGNGLEIGWGGHHILINPPFAGFEQWIEKGLDEAMSVCALLRIATLASDKRHESWKRWGLRAMYVLSSRPSFTGDGKSDSTDYAWFFWSKRPLDQLAKGLITMDWIRKPQELEKG